MASGDVNSSYGNMHSSVDALEVQRPPLQQGKVEDLKGPQQLFESGSDRSSAFQSSTLSLGLTVDSGFDEQQGHLSLEQIEKLKEFLSEAVCRGDDIVTQKDADAVKALENMQNLHLGTKSDMGLAARLQSAARTNFEIQNQAGSGYYPSETVYLEEHTLKEVLEESGVVISLDIPSTEVSFHTPRAELLSLDAEPSPTRNIDAESDLKNELDCLFQERAVRLRGSP